MRRYEAMFLFDNAVARDWSAIRAEVERLCSRIGAELEVCVKFDERKLAYEIRKRKRGTYVLTYFKAPPDRIADLERDARLSELILRLLVLRADGVTDARIKELQAWPAEKPLQPASESRRHEETERAAKAPAGAAQPAELEPVQAAEADEAAAGQEDDGS